MKAERDGITSERLLREAKSLGEKEANAYMQFKPATKSKS